MSIPKHSGDGASLPVAAPSVQLARCVQDVIKGGLPVYTTRLETLGTIAPAELPVVNKANVAADIFRRYFEGKDREELALMLLDRQNRVRGIAQVAIGTTTEVAHDPMSFLRPIVLTGATAVIEAHNHPCGDAWPSEADTHAQLSTEMLCFNVGIRYFDHIIIGAHGEAYSFRRGGIIE